MIGQIVSHYKILEHLGSGGMGVVYKAEDTLLKRTVALKFLPPALTSDPEAKERFIQEARAASALDHPNICAIHEISQTDDGQLFIVMACYAGETLKKKVEEGHLDIDLALDVAIQAASGLSRAHEAGIVHRDIKPANIMLTTHNEVKILDFGLAKLGGGSVLTRTGTTLGTAAYMSPEQARGEQVDRRSDIWSLGAVLYELLTGQRAFLSDYEQALVYSILNDEPKQIRELRPDVPDVVEQIIGKALAKSPEERYQTAEELLADLKIARGVEAPGGTIAAAEVTIKKQKKALRRSLTAAGLAVIFVAMGLFVGLPLLQDQALASHPRGIAFISLENNTGDGSLEYLRNVLPGVLSTTLGDSKYIRVTRSDWMREMMKQIEKDTVEFIDRETGLILCKRAGIDVMGVGRYTKAGPMFLAELELIDVNTGERLGSPIRARGRELESLLKEDGIVDDLARQVSKGMGVSQISTSASVKPIAEVSSSSIEAQRLYERGKLEYRKFNFKDGRHYLELAVKEDSTFAIAWKRLGDACFDMGDQPAGAIAWDRAKQNISRATEKEKFLIAEGLIWRGDSSLAVSLLKRWGRYGPANDAVALMKAAVDIFPNDPDIRFRYAFLLETNGFQFEAIVEHEKTLILNPAMPEVYNELGYLYAFHGKLDKGIEMLDRSAGLLPGDANPLESMAEILMMYGRYEEAVAKCEQVLRMKPDWGVPLAKLHFITEHYDEAIKWAERDSRLSLTSSNRVRSTWWRAFYLVWAGRLNEADATLAKCERAAVPKYDRQIIALALWLRGWIAFERSDWKNARRYLSGYATLARTPESIGLWFSEFSLGLLDVQTCKLDSVATRLQRMRETLDAFSRQHAEDSLQHDREWHFYGNALKAARLLASHRPAEIRPDWRPILRDFQHFDSLTTASWPIRTPWGNGYIPNYSWIPIPFDILPRAYVERGMIDSAIASYERAIKKPVHWLGPIIPRYYYRLARLYEQKGMKDRAIENYTTFLRVWGKADPVYKEPADARARLAKLKRG